MSKITQLTWLPKYSWLSILLLVVDNSVKYVNRKDIKICKQKLILLNLWCTYLITHELTQTCVAGTTSHWYHWPMNYIPTEQKLTCVNCKSLLKGWSIKAPDQFFVSANSKNQTQSVWQVAILHTYSLINKDIHLYNYPY